MSTKKNKPVEPIYVTRTTRVPLTENELFARMQELPLVISQQDRLAMRKKDLMAELKAEAEDLAEKIATLTGEINRKERTEDLRCLKHPVLTERTWHIMHPMTGEVMEKIPMGWEEYERLKSAAHEAEAEATAETQLDLPLAEAGVLVTPPQPTPLGLPPVGNDLPVLAIEAKKDDDDDTIEGEIVVEPGCYLGYHPDRFAWPAESAMGMLYHALHRYADGDNELDLEKLVEPHFWSAPGDIPTDAELLEYLAEAWGKADLHHTSGNKYDVRLTATWNGKEFRVKLSENCFDEEGRSTGSRSFARSGAELAKAIRGLLFAPVQVDENIQASGESSTPATSPSANAPESVDEKSGSGAEVVQAELRSSVQAEEEAEVFSITSWPMERRVFANAVLDAGLAEWITKDNVCPSYVQAKRFANTVLYGEAIYSGASKDTLKDADLFLGATEDLPLFVAHISAGGWGYKTKPSARRDAKKPLWPGSIAVLEAQRSAPATDTSEFQLFGEPQTTTDLVGDMAERLV